MASLDAGMRFLVCAAKVVGGLRDQMRVNLEREKVTSEEAFRSR